MLTTVPLLARLFSLSGRLNQPSCCTLPRIIPCTPTTGVLLRRRRGPVSVAVQHHGHIWRRQPGGHAIRDAARAGVPGQDGHRHALLVVSSRWRGQASGRRRNRTEEGAEEMGRLRARTRMYTHSKSLARPCPCWRLGACLPACLQVRVGVARCPAAGRARRRAGGRLDGAQHAAAAAAQVRAAAPLAAGRRRRAGVLDHQHDQVR